MAKYQTIEMLMAARTIMKATSRFLLGDILLHMLIFQDKELIQAMSQLRSGWLDRISILLLRETGIPKKQTAQPHFLHLFSTNR